MIPPFPKSLRLAQYLNFAKTSALLPSTSLQATSSSSTPPPASSSRSLALSRLFTYHHPRHHNRNNNNNRSQSLPTSSNGSHSYFHLFHFSLRSRRLIAQVMMIVFICTIAGMWVLGGPRATMDIIRFGAVGADSEYDKTLPGIVVGSGGKYEGPTSMEKGDDEIEIEIESGNVGGDIPGGSDDSSDGKIVDEPPSHSTPDSSRPKQKNHASLRPPTDRVQRWGIQIPDSAHLLAGLSPWPANPEPSGEPLSSLGHFADNIYKIGPRNLPEYTAQLREFVEVAFPDKLKPKLREGMKRYLSTGEENGGLEGEDWDEKAWRNIWMTDKLGEHEESIEVMSWKDKANDWKFDLLSDKEANEWIKKTFGQRFGVSHVQLMWDSLPTGILRADALRYLLLLMEGGIYSDTDTRLLQHPSIWGRYPQLWKGGEGWLDNTTRQRVEEEGIEKVLGRPSVIVGIEADVGTREDWFDWWPRPIQIVQWTMASAPYHPISLSAILRIIHSTADAADWAKQHWFNVQSLRGLGKYDEADKLMTVTVLSDVKKGGPVGVMGWTGPGVWTDAVLSYVRVKYGMQWTDLRGIQEPLRIGDVLILPVTGFSPGVGNFGAQSVFHHQAMVQHLFRGSWKVQDGG